MLRIQTKQKKSWYLFAVSWLYCKHLSCRAISVILGDRWKKMKNEERRMYTLEAKALAEEQKRLNPDCWKRKRTNSVCLWSNLFHYAVTYVQRCGYSVFCSEDTFLVLKSSFTHLCCVTCFWQFGRRQIRRGSAWIFYESSIDSVVLKVSVLVKCKGRARGLSLWREFIRLYLNFFIFHETFFLYLFLVFLLIICINVY